MKKILSISFTFLVFYFVNCSPCSIGIGGRPPTLLKIVIDSGIHVDSISINRINCSENYCLDINSDRRSYIIEVNVNRIEGLIEFKKNGKIIKDTFLAKANYYTTKCLSYYTMDILYLNNINQTLPFKRYFEDSLIYTVELEN